MSEKQAYVEGQGSLDVLERPVVPPAVQSSTISEAAAVNTPHGADHDTRVQTAQAAVENAGATIPPPRQSAENKPMINLHRFGADGAEEIVPIPSLATADQIQKQNTPSGQQSETGHQNAVAKMMRDVIRRVGF